MKIHGILFEKFITMLKPISRDKEPKSIYKNPTYNELKKLREESGDIFRILVDKNNKDIYVFSTDILHAVACKALDFDYHDESILKSQAFYSSKNNKLIYDKKVQKLDWIK